MIHHPPASSSQHPSRTQRQSGCGLSLVASTGVSSKAFNVPCNVTTGWFPETLLPFSALTLDQRVTVSDLAHLFVISFVRIRRYSNST
ncbi:hypothetical protein PoB_007494500 [Plakobranchus ocellatus]|uniref:Uncharacterized protein n=1 Tax=Plakobranchus ocellatus TaxID=259542 RepID=A0AAV4DWP9_9GAST|nr:hypothetical protein PoB_007494500 [Plakobranchus ocellatus]